MSPPRKTPIVHQPAAQLYDRFVEGIKQRIQTAQLKAVLAANAELVLHYWEIGRDILASQKSEGWGTKVVDRLAADLQVAFPRLAMWLPGVSSSTHAFRTFSPTFQKSSQRNPTDAHDCSAPSGRGRKIPFKGLQEAGSGTADSPRPSRRLCDLGH